MRKRLIAATLTTIILSIVLTIVAPKNDAYLPRNFSSPVLAAELVENASEIAIVYGTPTDQWHRALKLNTILDFAFILSYALNYFLLGRIMRGAFGTAVSALAILAALSDIGENLGILRALRTAVPTDALAHAIRVPSLIKWTLLAILWMSLFRLFGTKNLSTGWRLAELLTALFYALGGLICFIAVFDGNHHIEQALPLIVAATLLQLAIALFDAAFWQEHDIM